MTCGFYLIELIDRFIEDDTPHRDVYTLLLDSLRCLDADAIELQGQRAEGKITAGQEHSRTQLLLRYFEIYLLSCIGYEPVFRTCAHCNAALRPVENGFTPSLGGALCPNCAHLWAYPLSMNALKVLRLLQRTEWAQVPRLRIDPRLHTELELAMHGLLRFHLERDLKSWSFLEMLR
jgi:DNA repair protein RecO (recombination protein O)